MSIAFENSFAKLIHDIQAGQLQGWKIDLRESAITKKQLQQLADALNNNFHSVKNIVEIDLAYNNLSEIPVNMFKDCDALRILNLDNNKLKKLPKLPDRPFALQEFFASNNPLKTISAQYFANCVSLKAVYLTNTQITEAPHFNDSLSLAWLHLNANPIAKFSEKFFQYLEHLDILYINDTKLKSLPNLSACKKLHEVWVDDIQIKDKNIANTAQIIVCKTE